MSFKLPVLGLLSLISIFSISATARAESLGFSLSNDIPTAPDEILITVQDDLTLQPIADAQVTISDRLHFLPQESDQRGQTQQSQTNWAGVKIFKSALGPTAPKVITVSKPGYASVSIAGVQSSNVQVFLKPYPATTAILASGVMGNWPNPGSNIEAGIAIKALSAFDLLQFSPESLISPLKDTIDVLGPRQIPSNLILPEQDVFLPIGSITLNKPSYRLPLEPNRDLRIVGAQGQIALRDVLPLLQGGVQFEFLNRLVFTRIGITDSVRSGSDFKLDLNPNLELTQRHTVTATVAPFAADILVVPISDLNSDRLTLIPTDIKVAASASNPNQVKSVNVMSTKQPLGTEQDVLTVAIADKGARITGIVTARAGSTVKPGAFLNTPNLGRMTSLPETITIPAPSRGISALVFQAQNPQGGDRVAPVWTVYTLPAAGDVELPTTGIGSKFTVKRYSLMQMEYGQAFDPAQVDGHKVMLMLQRFAASTAKL